MSFYVTSYRELSDRKENNILYFEDGHFCTLLNGNFAKTDIEEKNDISDYEFMLSFAIDNGLLSFEVVFKDDLEIEKLENIISIYSDFLLENDYSIGLLFSDVDYIIKNIELFNKYGLMSNFVKKQLDEPIFSPPIEEAMLSLKCSRMAKKASLDISSSNELCSSIHLEESFRDKLLRFLIESNKSNVEVYTKGGITRQLFSKIISTKDLIPTKGTIICLIIGMELPYLDAIELLQSAGYVLSKSILFDAIVMKYLKRGIYDLDLINDELDENNLPLLGWKPR